MLPRFLITLLFAFQLVACASFDETYELTGMSVDSSDSDTDQAIAELNVAIADTDEVFELHIRQTDGDMVAVTLLRNGQVVGEAESEQDDFGRRGGEFEVHMTPSDFDLAIVTVTAPNGIWIRGSASSKGVAAEILFRNPNRSILEQIVEAVIEEAIEAVVEALIESLGGARRTIDLSNLDVVWSVSGDAQVTVE